MSTTPSTELDIAEQVARIRRAQVETDKFAEECRKLAAEVGKLARDRMLSPWALVVTGMGTGGALVGATVALMKVPGQ